MDSRTPPPDHGTRQTVAPRLLPRFFQILTGILLGMAVLLWWLPGRERGPGGTASGYFLPQALPAPSFTLTSQEGLPVSSGDFPEKVLAVFFGYTSCPDVCPLTLANLTRAFRELGPESEGVQVLFISVDPQRDTPDRLREYMMAFDPSFLGLTGTEEEIREVADGFGAYFARVGEGEDYIMDHTARVFVVAPGGTIPLTFPITATPQEMARDLGRLLEELP